MAPFTSLTDLRKLPERSLDRLIRRVALVLGIGVVLFAAFYALDRWRPAAPSIADQRITTLETAVREDPADLSARGQLADAYFLAERYQEAIREYTAILDASPALNQEELARFGRARAYESVGDLAAAKPDYQRVVDIARTGEMPQVDPMLSAAFYGLGVIALDEQKPADAVKYLGAAVAIMPADADALHLLGVAQLANGDAAAAVEALRRATAFVPLGWPEPYDVLGQAYAALGDADLAAWAGAMAALARDDAEAATAALTPLVDGPVGIEAMLGLAFVAESGDDLAGAAGWYNRVLDQDPTNASAQLGLKRVVLPAASAGVAP